MLRFSLFGFPISVHWMFWLVMALLSPFLNAGTPQGFQMLLLWILAGFVSIVIHELGHTFMQRRFGARTPHIHLYAFGGLAMADGRFTRQQHIIISLAGPLLQIVCGLLIKALLANSTGDHWAIRTFLWSFQLVSIFWGIFNLVPIYPLDGGHVLLRFLGPGRERTTFMIGAVLAAIGAVYMLVVTRSIWNTLLFGALAWENFQRAQGQQPPPMFSPR
jgi:stage IV sporulation protein FB